MNQFIDRFIKRQQHQPTEDHRLVHLNRPEENQIQNYLHNRISTAKYTPVTFLPKFLLEQFSKYANLFFLFTSIIQQIPGVSPTSRLTTIGPLLFVLFCTAIKEIMEDYKRHKSDDEVNNRSCQRLENGHFVSVLWKDLQVGDLIRVENNQFFPADLVLLSSSEPDALCYIETSNLDGETNLKIKQGRTETAHILSSTEAAKLSGKIKSELPNNSLYTFEGTMLMDGGKEFPLDPSQILLRGAMLRNTRWIYGIAIFTGHESKLMRNATAAPIKQTSLEKMTNTQIVLLFIILLVLSLSSAIGSLSFTLSNSASIPYIYYEGVTGADANQAFWLNILTFIILYNNLIPISLIVTMEVVKLRQATLINSDLDMYYEKHDTPAQARSSSLVEELGRVQFVFSDKTGTLTCNEMEFRECSIGGRCYTNDSNAVRNINGSVKYDYNALKKHRSDTAAGSNSHVISEFLTLLAVCHTVIPERIREIDPKKESVPPPDAIVYQASSPDEAALVSGAGKLGFYFHTRRPKSVQITVDGMLQEYEILNICEFNSTRKRMSAVVRCPDGKIKIYTKGADTVIFERLKRDPSLSASDPESLKTYNPHYEPTVKHLEDFATEGLRTLCIAMRDIEPKEYEEWVKIYEKAATTINNRQDELDKAAELIEKDLFLLGATAIEDRLQDGVPDTIYTLAKAGVKIWVLTGDRQETAINIGFSCKLLTEDMNLIIVSEETKAGIKANLERNLNQIKAFVARHSMTLPSDRYDPQVAADKKRFPMSVVQDCRDACASIFLGRAQKGYPDATTNIPLVATSIAPGVVDGDLVLVPGQLDNLALIIDGKALRHALDPEVEKLFLELATLCRSVICCRVSPLQKALVVKLVKNNMDAITLAIGDGANDVSMIQAAHVGVGISGNEGLQAARSSDFAICQFKYLKKLLLVHGTWSYHRLSKLVLYSFYKNITLYMTQFWFAFSNGFSGQTIYESWTISFYNVIFTLLPPLAIGIFEQFVSARMLEKFPQLYRLGQERVFFNVKNFWGWVFNAIYHSIVLYYLVIGVLCNEGPMLDSPNFNGMTGGQWWSGCLLYTTVLITVLLKASLVTDAWTKWTIIAVPVSFFAWMIFLPIYENISWELYGISAPLFGSATFWWCIIVVPVLCLIRDVVWKYLKRQNFAQAYHIVQEIQKYNIADYRPHADRFLKAVNRVRLINRMRKNRGYAFSQSESGQAGLIRQYDTTVRKPDGL